MASDTLDCSGDAVDVSNRGLRIASIFIVMVAAAFGAFLPIFLRRQSRMHVPKLTFFICKYIGTGVIIATAWMHLLAPAAERLSDPCLEPRLGEYDWAFAIGLMSVMVMFFVEMLVQRYSSGEDEESQASVGSEWGSGEDVTALKRPQHSNMHLSEPSVHADDLESRGARAGQTQAPACTEAVVYPPSGEDHLAHGRSHKQGDSHAGLGGQLTSLFILEFGVVFHSVFIGLTLGTTSELVLLLIVLVFHQMFEGLGLGSRLADAKWPADKQWLPYVLASIFALSTPMGVAIGMGAQPRNATDQKLVNGVFDAISAGILMYTGLVELLAHEFMFNPHMRKAPLKTLLYAFGCVGLGAFIMALLAKWA